MKIDRHHLLEIILWPNGDGTFKEIRNSAKKLHELGIYDDYKMCIEITTSEHARLHFKGVKKTAETKLKMKQSKSAEHRKHMSEAWERRRLIPTSEESKAKMREAWKIRKLKPVSDETRKRMSAKSSMPQKSKEFKLYKNNGGTMKWQEWLKMNKETHHDMD